MGLHGKYFLARRELEADHATVAETDDADAPLSCNAQRRHVVAGFDPKARAELGLASRESFAHARHRSNPRVSASRSSLRPMNTRSLLRLSAPQGRSSRPSKSM